MAKKADRKTCFVVGPIGADDSDDRIHADWLLEEIIQPVFAEHFQDFDVTRADKIADPGRIDAQVISHLLQSELVIADLTTLNPNAFYEIGIRHTVQKPIIHMHLEGQRIPFDIASFRSIKFERKRPKDLKIARDMLRDAIAIAVDDDHEIDNPVTFSRGRIEVSENATPAERIYQEQLDLLNMRLDNLEISHQISTGDFPLRDPTRWLPNKNLGDGPVVKVAISTRNTAPDADLNAAVEEIVSQLPGADFRPTGRTHGILYVPTSVNPRALLNFLKRNLSEDFAYSINS